MLKASALYIVIIISLVIAVLCSSLIVAAYFYRAQYQQQFRYKLLKENLYSGITILIGSDDSLYSNEKTVSLFGGEHDSVSLHNISWGIFNVGITKAFIQKDTLYKTFMIANKVDSSKWAALYVADEDRPISVSGSTRISGYAYLPKSGIQAGYVDNSGYSGDKAIVMGKKLHSENKLPVLNDAIIRQLESNFHLRGDSVIKSDSVKQPFTITTKIYNFGKMVKTLEHLSLKGNIVICSDTTLVIDSTVTLTNVLIFAKAVVVNHGFTGKCQIFASDSISVARNCCFNYPSCLGIVRVAKPLTTSQERITINEACRFEGTLFNYEKVETGLKPLISIGQKDTLKGQAYSQGFLELKNKSVVQGSAFAAVFLHRTAFTIYENYLINTTLDSSSLSEYYLNSSLLPTASKKKKILQWLEGN